MADKTDDTAKLVMLVAKRSRPNGTRPRMSEEVEARLDELEKKSAACYAELELAAHRAKKIARAVGGDETIIVDEPYEEDSLVTSVEALRKKTKPPADDPPPEAA